MQYLLQNQASPEITINDALTKIDAMIFGVVQSVVDTLPTNPNDGDVYILSASSATYPNNIVIHIISKGWQMITPTIGACLYILNTRKYIRYIESNWIDEQMVSGNNALPSLHSTAQSGNYNELNNKPYLHTVASSGSYDDLTNKPSFKSVSWTGSYNDLEDQPSISTNAIGDYKFSAQTSNHNKWFLCDGRAISRTECSSLFSVIGTSFGVGNGTTTFNIPDARGRVIGAVGQGMDLTNRKLGNIIGTEMHTLTISEIPVHEHNLPMNGTSGHSGGIDDFRGNADTSRNSYGKTFPEGGGLAHNNMQPTLFAGNLFIYADV